KEYWIKRLSNLPDPLSLPTDYQRTEVKKFKGGTFTIHFQKVQYKEMLTFCKAFQVSLFNFLHASIALLLHKYSGQKNMILGTPVAERNHADLENQIGFYVNTIALRTEIQANQTVGEFLKETAIAVQHDFQHQDFPFDELIEELHINRNTLLDPVFNVMLVLQNSSAAERIKDATGNENFEISSLDHYLYKKRAQHQDNRFSKFDLTFDFFAESEDSFRMEIEYSTELFKSERIEQLSEMYVRLIEKIIQQPDEKIDSLELLSARDKNKLLKSFNSSIGKISEKSIAELLEVPFKDYSKQIALVTKDHQFTYADIDERSDKLATFLRSKLKRGMDPFVGILMERSEWTLISILGIIKAGCTYVPIDVNYPLTRIAYMLNDADPCLIITDEVGKMLVTGKYSERLIDINEEKERMMSVAKKKLPKVDLREKIAYLIYTSGSTGVPKGVEICHRNTISFLKWALHEFKDTPFEILYAATSYCFDLSVFEFLFPLLTGKKIRLLDSALDIESYLPKDKAVMLNTVPSVVRHLLEDGVDLSGVVALNMAGEAVPKKFRTLLPYQLMEVRN
ncbi:MAG TPA: condensation domain-containing protein, partial [Bacteroidia bacterium]|nr:condensation domain-containing protein [Bacteroidia bacterium]